MTDSRKAGTSFDPNSRAAVVGARGEARARELINDALDAMCSDLYMRAGSSDPRANGIMGDITLSPSPTDAASVGIEVKTCSMRYPDSFCLSKFEFGESLASWVLVLNEDEDAGVWIVPMSAARAYASELKGGRYVVCRPPISSRVDFDSFIQTLEKQVYGD